MSLRFGTDIAAGAVKIDVSLESDGVLIEQIKTVVGTFPAAFYLTSQLFVRPVSGMPFSIEEIIDTLVGDFRKARGR